MTATYEDRVQRVLVYIHDNPGSDLSLDRLAAEAPALAGLHDRLMPELGLAFAGAHHEIYLSDPQRTEPEKLKTILRQPVTPATEPDKAIQPATRPSSG